MKNQKHEKKSACEIAVKEIKTLTKSGEVVEIVNHTCHINPDGSMKLTIENDDRISMFIMMVKDSSITAVEGPGEGDMVKDSSITSVDTPDEGDMVKDSSITAMETPDEGDMVKDSSIT